MFASLRCHRNGGVLANEIRAIRTNHPQKNFELFKTTRNKTRLEPPKPTRNTPTVPKQKTKTLPNPFKIMRPRPKTGAESRPSQMVKPDPLESKPILERRKLQALVSLYHQSRNFITREELDDHIDNEFGYAERLTATRLYAYGTDALRNSLHERRSTPTYTTSPPLFTFDIDPKAGTTRGRGLQVDRPQRLAGVMYGTDERGEPALEAVEEAIRRGGFPGGIHGRKGI